MPGCNPATACSGTLNALFSRIAGTLNAFFLALSLFLPTNAITGNNVTTAIRGQTPKLAYGHSSGIVDAVYYVRAPYVAPESQNLLPQVAECAIAGLEARLTRIAVDPPI